MLPSSGILTSVCHFQGPELVGGRVAGDVAPGLDGAGVDAVIEPPAAGSVGASEVPEVPEHAVAVRLRMETAIAGRTT